MKNPVDVRTKVKFKYIYRIQPNNKVPKQIHPKIVLNGIYTILIRNLFIQKILRSSQSRLWLSCKSWQNVYKIVNVQLPIIGNNSKLLRITTKSPFSSQELYFILKRDQHRCKSTQKMFFIKMGNAPFITAQFREFNKFAQNQSNDLHWH